MAGPAVDEFLEEEESKVMESSRYAADSRASSRARGRARSQSRSRSQTRRLSSTPIPKLATKVDIPRIRIDTGTPASQSTQQPRHKTHLRTISLDTIDLAVRERPSPPSSPEEEIDMQQYPPRHPVPSMQAAFEESMYEQLSIVRGETGGPGASANWRSSLQRSSRISSRASIASVGKSQYHPLEKLVAQVAFGVYLLHQGLAISEHEVVRILQGHVNDMDDFLSTTTRDFGKAREEIFRRTQHLKFPLDMGPPAATIFEKMLRDKKFRTELLENNAKVESIVRKTVRMSTKALKDIDEGLKTVRHLARYLASLKEGWRSKNLLRVYAAMVQNVEQWCRCLIGLQKKGTTLADKLSKLKSVLFEIEKRAGAASRADVKSLQPSTRTRVSARKSEILATKPLPQTPIMTPVILPIQKPDPSTLDLSGDSPDPQPISLDNIGFAPSPERRPPLTKRNSVKRSRPVSRGRRQSIRFSSANELCGLSPVSPISTIQDKSSKSVFRRKSTKRSTQSPSPVSPITDRDGRSSSMWPKVRQSSSKFTSHPNRPISFLLENSDDNIEAPPLSNIEPLRVVKRDGPLPVPNPYGSSATDQPRSGYKLPRTLSEQPPITMQLQEAMEFYGENSVENLKVPKESKAAPRIKTPDIPTPFHFEFTFDSNNTRSNISPILMLSPAETARFSPGFRPRVAAPSPPRTPQQSEPSASMIEALHPVHPGSHFPIPASSHTLPTPPSSGINPVDVYEDPLRLGPLVGPGDDIIEIQGEPITVRRLQEQEAEQRKSGVRRLLYDENGIRRCGKCKLGTRVFGGVKGDVVFDEEERGRRRDKDRTKNEKRFEKEEKRLRKEFQVRNRSEERRNEMDRLKEEGKCEVM